MAVRLFAFVLWKTWRCGILQGQSWADCQPCGPLSQGGFLGDGELILVVEDNDTVRKATANRLESLGYAVLDAKTGPDAMRLLEAGEPCTSCSPTS